MKRTLLVAVIILTIQSSSYSKFESKTFKAVGRWMPTPTEIGFLAGAVNTYMQAATLVRTTAAQIRQTKRFVKRLDDLKRTSENMWSNFKDLQHINIYDMDSWVNWLDRAEGLTMWQTSSFFNILKEGMTEIDSRLTRDFVASIKSSGDYDVFSDDGWDVIAHYYYNTNYYKYRNNASQALVNNQLQRISDYQNKIILLRAMIKEYSALGKYDEVAIFEKEKAYLVERLAAERGDVASVMNNNPVDKQLRYLSESSAGLFTSLPKYQDRLSRLQKKLMTLTVKWKMIAEGKMPKDKDIQSLFSAVNLEGQKREDGSDRYEDPGDGTRPNLARLPTNDIDRQEKYEPSSTNSKPSLKDVQYLKNEISFVNYQIEQLKFEMNYEIASRKALLLASYAYESIKSVGLSVDAAYEGSVLEYHLRKKAKEL